MLFIFGAAPPSLLPTSTRWWASQMATPFLTLFAAVSGVVGVAFQVGIGPLIFRHALVLVCDDVLLRAVLS